MSETPEGYYREGGELKRQHDVYGGPHDEPPQPAGSGNGEQVVWALTRGHLEEMVGRPLTDDEVARVAKCFEYSSIGDVINGVTESCGLWPPDEDEECE